MKEKFNNLFGGGSAGAYTWFGVKKELLIRLAVAVVLFCAGLFTSGTVLMLLSFLVVGYDVIGRAILSSGRRGPSCAPMPWSLPAVHCWTRWSRFPAR